MKYTMGKASWCFITDEHALKVTVLETKKVLNPRGSIYDCWLRETTCLDRLRNKLHFPNMIGSDETDLVWQ